MSIDITCMSEAPILWFLPVETQLTVQLEGWRSNIAGCIHPTPSVGISLGAMRARNHGTLSNDIFEGYRERYSILHYILKFGEESKK